MTHELPDDIELPLSHWESGEREQARERWQQLRQRPGTIGELAQRCLELAERGVDTIRSEIGPLPAADEIGWEEMLFDDGHDGDDLDLGSVISGLSSKSGPPRPQRADAGAATPTPTPTPAPATADRVGGVDAFFDEAAAQPQDEAAGSSNAVTPPPLSAVDFFFDDVFETDKPTAEHDGDELELALDAALVHGSPVGDSSRGDEDDDDERPPSAQRLRIVAPRDEPRPQPVGGLNGLDALTDDDDDDDPLFGNAHHTRQRDAQPSAEDADGALDDFFGAGRDVTPVRADSSAHSGNAREDSTDRRAAETLTRRDGRPDTAVRGVRPLDAPSRTPPSPSQTGDFFDDLFEQLPVDEDIVVGELSEDHDAEPQWLGGIEPVRESTPRVDTEAARAAPDISADLDDLREIFGETSRLVEEDGASAGGDPWAEMASELAGVEAGGRVHPMPSRRAPQADDARLDERPRTVPRNRVPASRGTSRYAPEPARPAAVRPDQSFPRTRTPVRQPSAVAASEPRSPLSNCQRVLDDGNPFGAYTRALEYRQHGEEGLDDFVTAVREQLLGMAVELIKPLDRCPTLKIPPAAIPSLKNIDHRGGYLLSQIDGMSSIEFLIDLGAMPRPEAALLLLTLAERAIITLD